ncbi:MAG: lysylphosphatidylglycerol synthase transmembrane domain-containing protein [bacterium]
MRLWKNKQFWGTIIAVALLAFCVKDIRLSELRVLSERLSIGYLLPAVACTFLFVLTKTFRWKLMISHKKKLSAGRVIGLYSAGQILNIVMPALTGQVGRMILFARREGLRKTFVFSTIILEILFDAISLVVLLLATSVAFVFPDEYRYMSYVIASVTLAVLIGLYLMLHYQTGLEDFGRRRLRDRWPGMHVAFKKFIRSFTKGIESLRSSQHFFGSLFLSFLSWTAHMLVVYFLLKSFGYSLPIAAAASVVIINTLALMVPVTPANAGTFEVAVSTSLAAFSVARSDAVLFAVALHILDLLPIVALGLGFVRSERAAIKQIKSENVDKSFLDEINDESVAYEGEVKP